MPRALPGAQRSAAQLARKTKQGYEARLAAHKDGRIDPRQSSHWREIAQDVAHGVALDDDRLRLVAANYTVPRTQWTPAERVELVEDPVLLRTPAKTRAAAPAFAARAPYFTGSVGMTPGNT